MCWWLSTDFQLAFNWSQLKFGTSNEGTKEHQGTMVPHWVITGLPVEDPVQISCPKLCTGSSQRLNYSGSQKIQKRCSGGFRKLMEINGTSISRYFSNKCYMSLIVVELWKLLPDLPQQGGASRAAPAAHCATAKCPSSRRRSATSGDGFPWYFPMVPSGKHTKNYGKIHHF